MPVSTYIETVLEKSSWIRKMFEEGGRLKAEHGADKVYDFSLGNPNVPPPDEFRAELEKTVASLGDCDHGYMPNTGYPFTCEAVASQLAGEQKTTLEGSDVIMTCGAAGGLNIILKALLDPGDEVLTPIPCFVEYGFYAANHGGVLKTVPTKENFTLDIPALQMAISEKTRVVLINSPNNPTGQIYSAESLAMLGEVLSEKSRKFGRTIYLVSDEPYRKIVYDGAEVPGIFAAYGESIIASSYSKEISIPGERLGYVAVNPAADGQKKLLAGMALANRILGFVNAPALMQRIMARIQGANVDVSIYAAKRAILCEGLANSGYEFVTPPGAFYLFPESPVPEEIPFVQELLEEGVLVVPGTGFGRSGFFRIAYCVEEKVIENALPAFDRVLRRHRTG